MSATVAQTYLVELDAKTVELEGKLAAANLKVSAFERRLQSLQQTNAKTATSSDKMGLSFEAVGDKIKFSALAIGAALVAIEVKATEMAASVDGSLKQIGAASPALRGNLEGVRDEINAVAETTGRSKEEIRGAAEEIARLGVASKAEFDAKLNAATLIADATGTQLTNAVDGVDQLSDAFDLSADKIVESAAKIYSASKGRVDFDSVFGALKQSIPRIKELGIDIDTAIRAIVAKLDQGYSGKKLGAFFTDHDAETIRAVANEAHIAAGAVGELTDAATLRRSGGDREITRAINEYKTALESLGNETLPLVTKEFAGLAGVLATIDGTMNRLQANSAISVVRQAGAIGLNKLSPQARTRAAGSISSLVNAEASGDINLGAYSREYLSDVRSGVESYIFSLKAAAIEQGKSVEEIRGIDVEYSRFLATLNKVIDAQGKAAGSSTAGAAPAGSGRTKPGHELTIAQKSQLTAFNQSFAAELASLSPDKSDDLDAKIQKIRDDAAKLADFVGAKTLDVEGKVARLRGSAAAAAAVQLAALKNDLQTSIAGLSEGQAASFEAASDKFIAQKRKELAALVGISAEERTAFAQRIVEYEVQAANAATGLRALDAQAKAERSAALAVQQLDQQAAILQEREAQLTAVIENGNTSRAVRLEAERQLKQLRDEQIELAKREAAAVTDEIAQISAAIARLSSLRDQIQELHPDDKTAGELTKKIEELQKLVGELQLKLAQLSGTQDKSAKAAFDTNKKTTAELEKQARIIRTCVDGAIQLAGAFGLVDQKTVSVLENIANMAANLPLAAAGGAGQLGAIAAVVTSFAGIVSTFGSDTIYDERRRAQEQEIAALKEVAGSLAALNQHLDADKAIFGDKGPLYSFQQFFAGVSSKVKNFSGMFPGDPSTPEGRDAIRKAIQEFYARVGGAGSGSFSDNTRYGSDKGFPGLNGSDYLAALEQLIQYLDQIDQQQGAPGTTPGTGGYTVTHQITEATGSRLAGILTSGLAYQQRSADGIEALVAYFTAANSLKPITVPGVSLGGGGTVISIETLTIQVTIPGGTGQDGAVEIGNAVGAGVLQAIEGIDAGIGLRLKRRTALRTVYLD